MNNYKLPVLRLLTNIPEFITFNFNDFRTGQGQYGTWYKYEITHKGEAKAFFPTEYLHNKLQSLAPLEGKTIQILKYETSDGKTAWKLMDERGDELEAHQTPKIDLQAPPKQEVGNYVSREEFEAYKSKIEARIKYLEDFGNADVQEELKLEDIKF